MYYHVSIYTMKFQLDYNDLKKGNSFSKTLDISVQPMIVELLPGSTGGNTS